MELIKLLTNEQFLVLLTTDKSTKYKFNKIYKYYKIISNNDFNNLKIIDEILILDNLEYDLWTKIIYSANNVITPVCGCSHIAAAMKTSVSIIYDANNLPEAIHKEYAPWTSNYNKFIFNENNLNQKLVSVFK